MYHRMWSICQDLTPPIFSMFTPVVLISSILVSNTQIFGAELGDGHNSRWLALEIETQF